MPCALFTRPGYLDVVAPSHAKPSNEMYGWPLRLTLYSLPLGSRFEPSAWKVTDAPPVRQSVMFLKFSSTSTPAVQPLARPTSARAPAIPRIALRDPAFIMGGVSL